MDKYKIFASFKGHPELPKKVKEVISYSEPHSETKYLATLLYVENMYKLPICHSFEEIWEMIGNKDSSKTGSVLFCLIADTIDFGWELIEENV